ncbi:hypothetical protein OE09_0668 [Flavobacteriaceae bacterium MAR_2010_72]|nr:hypothetical protein OE09_0668 [Flavobacteriaceae bacterium MAR_2010_72]
MIESDKFSYEFSKLFLGIISYFFIPIGILALVYFSIAKNNFQPSIILLLILNTLFIYLHKKSKTNYYLVKMNDDKILCKIDGQLEKEINWSDVLTINRVPFFVPPLYFMKVKKCNAIIFFPTNSHLNYFSIFTGWFTIIWDFSKMGKHIRKTKKERNINSYYLLKLKN